MIKVIDDFLHDHEFDRLRQEAIHAEYIDWAGPDGQVYKRICIINDGVVQAQIQHELDTPVDMLGMAFRLNYEGEQPNQSIHTDVGWGTHAMVLYLNGSFPDENHPGSGTAFWKHIDSGATRLKPNDLSTYIKIRNDWEDSSKWGMTNWVFMKANRAVIYESELFHSRYPFEAFGSTPEDGRLILVAFFTPRNEMPKG